MGRPTWKIRFCNWILLISLHPITLSESAFPIDIVTEKITVPKKMKNYEILAMIPDKKPMINRRYIWRPTTTKRYALYLKYYDSQYEDYDHPFVTVKPRYPIPGMEFGGQVAKAQLSPILFKMVMDGNMKPHPRGTFKPPRHILIPEEIENYKHVNFHFNHDNDRPVFESDDGF